MMGPHGLYQHATRKKPNLREGYCADDNARAVHLLVAWLAAQPNSPREELEVLLSSSWQFLIDAQQPDGTYYNFRSASGQWLTHDISDDMYARLARAFASVIRYDTSLSRQQQAAERLGRLAPILDKLTSLRGWAETNIAFSLLPPHAALSLKATAVIQKNVDRLLAAWHEHATPEWPWFEPVMTYANALIPHGLLASRKIIQDSLLDEALELSANFLIRSTIRDGLFVPIGSSGWYPKGEHPSSENQQPIEAGTMFEFLLSYHAQFPNRLSPQIILAPYLWFFGANTNKQLMANTDLGASYDGLFRHGPNVNCGAESMLAYLTCELLLSAAPADIQRLALTERRRR